MKDTRLDVETGLTDVEQRLSILQAIAAYSHFFDARDAAAWANLFADDGIWESRTGSREGPRSAYAKGRAAIRHWAQQRYADLGDHARFLHHQSSTLFDDLHGTRAGTRTLVMVTRTD